MEYIELNNGVLMPIIGFGTYFPSHEHVEEATYTALTNGYNMLDTASWYNNERLVGMALYRSKVRREDIFITNKVQCGKFNDVINTISNSLKNIGCKYFDLILVHWPTNDYLETYRALEYLYENGYARAIGISNFPERLCNDLLNVCKIKPQVNQIETNIYFQELKMNNYLNRVGIVHEAWSTFCEGYCDMLKDPVLIEIGEKYNKSAAQVALRFFIEKNIIVLPRSSNPDHIKENLEVFDFSLDDEDRQRITELDKRRQYSGWPPIMLEETRY